jgi:hypothetical protein
LDADITVDDDFTTGHALPYMVEPLTGTFDANSSGVTNTQPEYVADIDAIACCLQLDALDLRSGLARKKMWDKRRQIEPLIRALSQTESKRLHGNRSRKW